VSSANSRAPVRSLVVARRAFPLDPFHSRSVKSPVDPGRDPARHDSPGNAVAPAAGHRALGGQPRRAASCLTRYYTGGAAGEEFDGIPLSELPIDEVVWSEERAKHIRTRAERKGPAEINIEPLWASEAALDPNRLVRRGSGRESVEVLGYSPSARRVLLVWIYTTEHPPSGSGKVAAR
jgi:hypothetical protein